MCFKASRWLLVRPACVYQQSSQNNGSFLLCSGQIKSQEENNWPELNWNRLFKEKIKLNIKTLCARSTRNTLFALKQNILFLRTFWHSQMGNVLIFSRMFPDTLFSWINSQNSTRITNSSLFPYAIFSEYFLPPEQQLAQLCIQGTWICFGLSFLKCLW